MTTLVLALLAALGTPPPRAAPEAPAKASTELTEKELAEIDRDDAAGEAAADAGDFTRALRYMDFFGHEQEDFATAVLEYGRDQRTLRRAVLDKLGERAWRHAAAALGVPRRRGRGTGRTARREGDIVFLRNEGAEHDVPYVKVGGVWKVSVRDVLLGAVKASLGEDAKFEEADLHVLAGKMAKVIRQRGKGMSDLAERVRSGRIASDAELREAAGTLRRGAPRR